MKNPLSIDRLSVARQFDRIADRLAEVDFLLREVQQRVINRLEYIKIDPAVVLDVGCGRGEGSRALAARFPNAQVVGLDLSTRMVQKATELQADQLAKSRSEKNLFKKMQPSAAALMRHFFGQISRKKTPVADSLSKTQQIPSLPASVQFMQGDGHSLPFANGSVDLICSNLALHWFDDPVAAIKEWRRVIKPGGLVMFSSFGPDTLQELATVGAMLPTFQDLHDLGDALQTQKFAEPVMDMEKLTISYQDVARLKSDLNNLGGNPLRQRHSGLRGRQFASTLQDRLQKLTPGSVTFELVYGHAWAPLSPLLPDGYSPIEFRSRPRL